MCRLCKNMIIAESVTTHVVNYKSCIIVVKNVPCLKCDRCGEKYYIDEVAEKLEIIMNLLKQQMPEIAVIDYQRAVQTSTSNDSMTCWIFCQRYYR